MMKIADPKRSTQNTTDQEADLDRRYRRIGISAVAAAVRYQGDRETATEVTASPKRDWSFGDAA
jgi:hypothetical protein